MQINMVLCIQHWERKATFPFTFLPEAVFRTGILSQFVSGEAIAASKSAADLPLLSKEKLMTTGEFRHLTGVPITFLFHCLFLKQPAVPLFIAVFAIKAHVKWWTQWMYVNNFTYSFSNNNYFSLQAASSPFLFTCLTSLL